MLRYIMRILLVLVSPFVVGVVGIAVSCAYWYWRYRWAGLKPARRRGAGRLRPSIPYRLFVQFPARLMLDVLERDPDEFPEYGLHMFCGEQGSGKTIAVVELAQRLRRQYPRCKIRSNMGLAGQDGEITHWRDLVANENGVYGQVEILDEIQAWFSSNQSRDFPPEMLAEISQQRKQRKMLVGTAQVFSRIAKPIREQTTRVYLPVTLFGCLTWVRITRPEYWDDDKQMFRRYIGHYWFVHTAEMRDAFDTYRKIERYRSEGFAPRDWHVKAGN
jgi:hypothetical protein